MMALATALFWCSSFLAGNVQAQSARNAPGVKPAITTTPTGPMNTVKPGPTPGPCDAVFGFAANLSFVNFRANDCGARTITVSLCNGVGPFHYYWNSTPASNGSFIDAASITVSPLVRTTYNVAVFDAGANQWVRASVTVNPIITGSISAWAPNIFTPNGDGINDVWKVMDGTSSHGTGPLNAWGYHLRIFDRWGGQKVDRYYTDTRFNSLGLIGGQIQFNGIDDNGGGLVDGDYYFRVDFYNCDLGCSCQHNENDFIKGWVSIFGSPYRPALSTPKAADLGIYPNPANEKLVVNPDMIARLDGVDNHGELPRSAAVYKVELLDKTGRVRYSGSATQQALELDTKALPEGIYYLRIVGNKGNAVTKQIVVDHSR